MRRNITTTTTKNLTIFFFFTKSSSLKSTVIFQWIMGYFSVLITFTLVLCCCCCLWGLGFSLSFDIWGVICIFLFAFNLMSWIYGIESLEHTHTITQPTSHTKKKSRKKEIAQLILAKSLLALLMVRALHSDSFLFLAFVAFVCRELFFWFSFC